MRDLFQRVTHCALQIGELCEQKPPVTIAFFAASFIITNTGNEP